MRRIKDIGNFYFLKRTLKVANQPQGEKIVKRGLPFSNWNKTLLSCEKSYDNASHSLHSSVVFNLRVFFEFLVLFLHYLIKIDIICHFDFV